ncbi:MAG: HAMP domain-containing protein [Leptospirales bacterium]
MEILRKFVKKTKSILGVDESRIKKKLILYFILISTVSISISLEVILEVSETPFREKLAKSILSEVQTHLPDGQILNEIPINMDKAFEPLEYLRIRMILLFLVIIGTIITAFSLFSKDIATPIDELVEGAKKVADGDLTYTIPVLSDDEIGQLARLINDMNANLQELVVEIRFEMKRMVGIVDELRTQLAPTFEVDLVSEAVKNRTIKISKIKKVQNVAKEVDKNLNELKEDLAALTMLIDMYKVYQVTTTNQDQEV